MRMSARRCGLWTVVAGVLLALGMAASASARDFYSVAAIFSSSGATGHLPYDYSWSPDSSKLTFLLRKPGHTLADLYAMDVKTGKRSVLMAGQLLGAAAAPIASIKDERKKERITRYGVSRYHWSPQGDAIVYLRDQQVWVYTPSSGKARQITHEKGAKRNPRLSPDERWVSYVIDGQLHYMRLGGTTVYDVAEPEPGVINGGVDWVYREEFGVRSGYVWSPDSQYIAFMQFDERPVAAFPLVDYTRQPPVVRAQKYPRPGEPNPIVRLGIHDIGKHATRWQRRVAGTRDSYLTRIGWQTGKRHRAYAVVLNREQTTLNLITVDPKTHRVRLLLNEINPYWVNVDARPRFLKRGRFVLATFTDGWKHLYLFDGDGNRIRNLTPGAFNVQFFAGMGGEGDAVYFTAATGGGPLNTGLYRVPLSGGAPVAVTTGAGTHRVYLNPRGDYYLDHFSTATSPPSATLRATADNAAVKEVAPAPKFKYKLLEPSFFTIKAADATTPLYARMLKPPHFDPHKSYPVVMYQYGGPHHFSVARNAWGGKKALFNQLLARRGFIVFAVDNRAAGYFNHQGQAQVKFKFGQLELADQRAAAQWLQSQPYVDSKRIGIWGWSYGGYMTLYELTHAPTVWAAGIAVAPVTRWQDYDSVYTERYMGTPKENRSGYASSSVVTAAGRLDAPVLIAVGTADNNVHWKNTLQFIQALVRHNKPYRLLLYPGKMHAISGVDARTHLYSAMLRFWQQHLQGDKR